MAGPRKSKTTAPTDPGRTLVLDNGAHTIKAGFVSSNPDDEVPTPRIIPNCLARDRQKKIYVASELDRCRDYGEMQFRRPVDKGYVVNWESQKQVWDCEFMDDDAVSRCDPSETRLVLAEAPNALPSLQTNCDQIVFEEYQFASYYRGIGPTFNAYSDVQSILRASTQVSPSATAPPQLPAEILLLVDCGYSHTTVTPLLAGRPLHPAVRRLDIGGKLMTNHLTHLLSLRHFDMRNDTHIVNDIKEAASYVSQDFGADLDICWEGTHGEKRETYTSGGGVAKDYILPDFHTRTKGMLVDYDPALHSRGGKKLAGDEDRITLRNERFVVPEILFNPSDIGIRQPGLADTIMHSIAELPIGLWPGLLYNIVVVGGCARIPGLAERLQREVIERAPDECQVRVKAARDTDPMLSTWFSGANLARHEHIKRLAVTKQEYDEHGSGWVARKFAAGLGAR